MQNGTPNEEFCKNYENHEIYEKKLKAIRNFVRTVENFKDWEPIEYAFRYSKRKFLTKTMQLLVDSVLEEYQIEYLDWCCETIWVKAEISSNKKHMQCVLPFQDLADEVQKEWGKSLYPHHMFPRDFHKMRSA